MKIRLKPIATCGTILAGAITAVINFADIVSLSQEYGYIPRVELDRMEILQFKPIGNFHNHNEQRSEFILNFNYQNSPKAGLEVEVSVLREKHDIATKQPVNETISLSSPGSGKSKGIVPSSIVYNDLFNRFEPILICTNTSLANVMGVEIYSSSLISSLVYPPEEEAVRLRENLVDEFLPSMKELAQITLKNIGIPREEIGSYLSGMRDDEYITVDSQDYTVREVLWPMEIETFSVLEVSTETWITRNPNTCQEEITKRNINVDL